MRKFLVFLSVALIVACCALPVFADEVERELFTLHIVDGVAVKENFVDGMYYVKVYNNDSLRADLGKVNLYYGSSYLNTVPFPNSVTGPYYLEISVDSREGNPPSLFVTVKDLNNALAHHDRTYVEFEPAPDDSPTQSVLGVFTSISTWISESLGDTLSLFYNESGLTLVGTLAVAGLGVSLVFFLIEFIKSFLRLGR